MTKKELLKKLPISTDVKFIESYKNSKDADILLVVVKLLGKFKNKKYESYFKDLIYKNKSSLVRREAVSSLGRLKLESNIKFFIKLCDDVDPNIVLQAIRALFVLRKTQAKLINPVFKKLENHSNEIVASIIQSIMTNSKLNHQKYNFPDYFAMNGDSGEELKILPDECIDLTFTSPPYYNARDYSIYKSYNEYLHFLEKIFKEVFRTTKEGRYLVVNTSPIILPRFSRSHSSVRYPIPFDLNSILMKMGWEFIDDIIWEKPEPSVMNRNGTFSQGKKPLTYKPNLVTEYIFVYRKKSLFLSEDIIKLVTPENQQDSSLLNEKIETTNIWRISPTSDKLHSAPFPQALSDKVIKLYSYKNDVVIDPFAGIGTVGKSCIELNRRCLLIEKDKTYFNEIVKRMPVFKENIK